MIFSLQRNELEEAAMSIPTLEDRVLGLERRLSEWEGQVGFLIPLTRQLHHELLSFREAVEEKFTEVDIRLGGVEGRLDRLEDKVDRGFAATLEQFQRIDHRFFVLDGKFVSLEEKVDAMPKIIAEIITNVIEKKR